MNVKRYSNAQILARVREHCVDNLLSVHSMSKPTYQAVKVRCDSDKALKANFDSLMAQSWEAWERLGIEALVSGNKEFNTPLYRALIQNKKPFLSYEVLELSDRVELLEEKFSANDQNN